MRQDLGKIATPPKQVLTPLPGLRLGSVLTTRGGVQFVVREAAVMVAEGGGESPSLAVERIRSGKTTMLFLTVGMLANLTRGAMHRRGSGAVIDWATVDRRNSLSNKALGMNSPYAILPVLRHSTPP
jgi:hypothetical protein